MHAVYLRPDVVLEPLYQQWYAWPHLVAPATAALNVRRRHLQIMESFLQAPAIHARFARAPSLIGSPYMDLDAEHRDEIAALRDQTLRDHAQVLELADALAALAAKLAARARGHALGELYAEVPEPLRGCVELVYDADNRAGFRLIESLLYRSRYYDVAAQSVLLQVVDRDERPFVLSTPRLAAGDAVQVRVPFAHPGLDALFALRTAPGSYHEVCEALAIDGAQEPRFRALFTETAPGPRRPALGGGTRVRYFGHACVLVETPQVTILLDPVIGARPGGAAARYTYADLPNRIDYVLITHDHQDHVVLETLLQLRARVGQVVVPRGTGGTLIDPSLKLIFRALGFRHVVELDELDVLEVPGASITGVPFAGEHADLDIRSKLAYHLRIAGGPTILFAADSCSADPELDRRVSAVVGRVDLLFLGMECDGAPLSWLYGPLLSARLPRDMDHSRRLAGSDYQRAMRLIEHYRPSEVYIYAMGQEPWLRHLMALVYTEDSRPIVESNRVIASCRARGIAAERLCGTRELHGAA